MGIAGVGANTDGCKITVVKGPYALAGTLLKKGGRSGQISGTMRCEGDTNTYSLKKKVIGHGDWSQ